MADLNISRAFIVTMNDGRKYNLAPGLNRGVPEDVAAHQVIQYLLVPEDGTDEMRQPVPDARGVGELVQARAAAEESATRLRVEVARLTMAWSEADIRARGAEAQVADLTTKLSAFNDSGSVGQTAFDDMVAQRDALQARVTELESSVGAAAGRVEGLTQEFQAQPSPVPATPPVETPSSSPLDATSEPEAIEEEPDEKIGDYTVRRRGKKYMVVKLDADGNTVATVDTFDSKLEAEQRAENLKSAL